MAEKQVATFAGFIGVGEHPFTGEINATLRSVDHPRLGRAPILCTSRLERMGYDDAGNVVYVETRNTVYLRAV